MHWLFGSKKKFFFFEKSLKFKYFYICRKWRGEEISSSKINNSRSKRNRLFAQYLIKNDVNYCENGNSPANVIFVAVIV